RLAALPPPTVGPPFSPWAGGRHPQSHRRAGAETSDLVDGAESDDRFGNADEQRSRTDRGASLVCADARTARRAGAPAIDRSWARGVSRRLGHRPARLAGHAYTDLTLPGMAGAHGYAGAAVKSGANCDPE